AERRGADEAGEDGGHDLPFLSHDPAILTAFPHVRWKGRRLGTGMRARYTRWDGSQDPLGPDLPAADLLEEMSEDILSGAGAEGALMRLLRRGMSGRFTGLDALRARLRQAARRERERLNLDAPLQELEQRLGEILEDERRTL